MHTIRNTSLFAALLCAASSHAADNAPGRWPMFRGPGASGVADGAAPPITWNVESGENVLWKSKVAGLGHASPIVWDDRVFVVSAISGRDDAALRVGLYGDIWPVEDDTAHRWMLYCFDRPTGNLRWEKVIVEGVPKIKRHTKATHANATPATDGKHVVVMLGSEGLHCFSIDGEPVWRKDFGVLDSGYYVVPPAQWGFASSPVIAGDRVIVQCDVQKDSFIAALALADGKELWRTPRDEVPTWSTPTVHVDGERAQIIVNGYKHIGGYDLNSGAELWKMRGGGDIPVPTPVIGHGNVFIANAHGMAAPLYAVRLDAAGDISLTGEERANAGIAWAEMNNRAYMQTPLVLGDQIYSCTDNGILSCYDARTGNRVYRNRLGSGQSGFTASPVASREHLYFTSEDGDVYVVQAGAEFNVVAQNSMGEVCMATPAISDGMLIVRTQGHLVAIAAKGQPVKGN